MALNMVTDKKFDEALKWLSEKEKKTKSDIIRELVLRRMQSKKTGFQFGALAHLYGRKKPSSKTILKELKQIDKDHDIY
jgi:predicted DNA-binding protein